LAYKQFVHFELKQCFYSDSNFAYILSKTSPPFLPGASYIHCRYSDRTAHIQDFQLTRRDAVQHDLLFPTNQSSEVWT